MLGTDAEHVLDQLRELLPRAHCPYSNFCVAALVKASNGSTSAWFHGVNVENVAYPVGMCAERVAIGAAVTAGYKSIDYVAVAAATRSNTGRLLQCTPCGMCRQTIAEFGPSVEIYTVAGNGLDGGVRIGDLLPDTFSEIPRQ